MDMKVSARRQRPHVSGQESAESEKTAETSAHDNVCVSIPRITVTITAFKPKRLNILRNPFLRNSGRTGLLVEGQTAVPKAVPSHSAKTTSTRVSTIPERIFQNHNEDGNCVSTQIHSFGLPRSCTRHQETD